MEQDTSTAERIRENVQVLRDIGTPVQMIKVWDSAARCCNKLLGCVQSLSDRNKLAAQTGSQASPPMGSTPCAVKLRCPA